MFTAAYLFTALTAFLSVVSAAPAAGDSGIEARAADAGILLMCQNTDFRPVCVNHPPTPNECISFFGNYALLNKHLSSIDIPRGFECTLYEAFGCTDDGGNHSLHLTSGQYPDLGDEDRWNDVASSIICVSANF